MWRLLGLQKGQKVVFFVGSSPLGCLQFMALTSCSTVPKTPRLWRPIVQAATRFTSLCQIKPNDVEKCDEIFPSLCSAFKVATFSVRTMPILCRTNRGLVHKTFRFVFVSALGRFCHTAPAHRQAGVRHRTCQPEIFRREPCLIFCEPGSGQASF